MRNVKAVAGLAAGLTMIATVLVGVVTPAHAAIAYKLSVSTHLNRSHAVSLNGATLKGKVYIFATPAKGALRVKFYLDGKLVHTETTPPYDFMGGQGDSNRPTAYNTAQLKNGKHTLHISVDQPNKQHSSYTAKFGVKNTPAKPYSVRAFAGHGQVTVSWHVRKGTAATRFYVYRGTHPHVTLRHPISPALKGSARKYTDTSVTSGHRYYYVVLVVASSHGSASSNPAHSGKVLPSNLAVVTAKAMGAAGKVTLSWSTRGSADRVRIYKTTSKTVSLTKPAVGLVGTTKHWTDPNVTDGTLYRYVVELVQGTHKVHSAALTATPLAAPTGVTLTGVSNGIKVSWTAGGPGVTSYAIYRSTSTKVPLSGPLQTVGAAIGTWTDTTAMPGTTYSYAVQALGLHGQAQTTVTATPASAPTLNPPTSGHNSVSLVWTAPSSGAGSVTEYDIFRGGSGADALTRGPVHTQSSGDVTWTDPGVTDNTTYFYVVRAISNGGTSDSGAVQATPLAAPANLAISLDGSNRPVLTWDTDTGTPATRYRIFRSTSSPVSLSTELTHVLGAAANAYTDTSATLGQTYYYVVQASYSDSTGSGSANSGTQSISTPQNAANVATPTLGGDGFVHITWSGVDASATSVEVYRSDSDQTLGDLVSGSLPPTANEYTDADTLTSGDTVFYTVRVIGPGGHTDAAPVEYDVP